jgi:hypothetical protein
MLVGGVRPGTGEIRTESIVIAVGDVAARAGHLRLKENDGSTPRVPLHPSRFRKTDAPLGRQPFLERLGGNNFGHQENSTEMQNETIREFHGKLTYQPLSDQAQSVEPKC